MFGSLRIVMFMSDGFGSFGGISRFNRDFLSALDHSHHVERVQAVPRVISEPITESIPESVVYDRKAARGKPAILLRSLTYARRNHRTHLVICGHLNLLAVAYFVARLQRARLVLILHGIDAWVPTKDRLVNVLARRIDSFIAVSQYTADRFTSWSGARQEHGLVLPNCVDLEKFVAAPRNASLAVRYGAEQKKVLMTMGRMESRERYKGFDEVIDSMPALLKHRKDLVYLAVGDGPDRPRLEAKARALKLDGQVIFPGRIPECEKVDHYNLADVYVMPSSGEGFGIVLIEAAACGVPLVGSVADGSRDALLNGRLGQLIDPHNPQELVAAVLTALEKTHERLQEVETFGVPSFQARISAWLRSLREQMSADFVARRVQENRHVAAG